jgi:YD repeat-containing protein
VSETDPLGYVTSDTYDANGNLIAKTDGNGATTQYTYDSLGRLLKKTYSDATAVTFTYDPKGHILTAGNQNISYSFTYDANGNVTSVTDSNGRGLSYGYNAVGNKTKMVSPDGRTITYNYDTGGRLTSIVDGGTFTFGYDSLGRRSRISYPNGDVTTYGYDKAGRLTSLVQKNSVGAVIASNTYSLDQVGNRLGNTTGDTSIAYQYDPIYRLTQALYSTPGYSGNSTGKGEWNRHCHPTAERILHLRPGRKSSHLRQDNGIRLQPGESITCQRRELHIRQEREPRSEGDSRRYDHLRMGL